LAAAGFCAALTLDAGAASAAAPALPGGVLTVCADPANLPYSSDKQDGFENRIATLLAADLHAQLKYVWFAEHRNFLRRTLLDGVCDVVISLPAGMPVVAETKPYFTSSYVAVMRDNDTRHFASFDDGWLAAARIGLQLVGSDDGSTPPVASLAQRGLNQHITAFPMWADAAVQTPQAKIIDAVANGGIDIAFVWGPFAGYFAQSEKTRLRVVPVTYDAAAPSNQFVFAMAAATRRNDVALRDALQAALDRHRADIQAILKQYGIPTVPALPVPQTH
jgi:mxaJ protein